MKFAIQREDLLHPLQNIIGAVERRQTMPVLACVLVRCTENGISLVATDLEIEMVAFVQQEVTEESETTLPARKLLDICRALPEGVMIDIHTEGERALVRSGRSRFQLATFPAGDFPRQESFDQQLRLDMTQEELRDMMERTAFAMAQQDVRYYLNGLMLEIGKDQLASVATDGHRLAIVVKLHTTDIDEPRQIIVPRKAVVELQRLLDRKDRPVQIGITSNHIRVDMDGLQFTSKLIDGRYPDYHRVIPACSEDFMVTDRALLMEALSRASILSNEKYRGVRLSLSRNSLTIEAHNPEQEKAEEEIEVAYEGPEMEVGFNVNYLLEALNAIGTEKVHMHIKDPGSSALLMAPDSEQARYVIMPMRL